MRVTGCPGWLGGEVGCVWVCGRASVVPPKVNRAIGGRRAGGVPLTCTRPKLKYTTETQMPSTTVRTCVSCSAEFQARTFGRRNLCGTCGWQVRKKAIQALPATILAERRKADCQRTKEWRKTNPERKRQQKRRWQLRVRARRLGVSVEDLPPAPHQDPLNPKCTRCNERTPLSEVIRTGSGNPYCPKCRKEIDAIPKIRLHEKRLRNEERLRQIQQNQARVRRLAAIEKTQSSRLRPRNGRKNRGRKLLRVLFLEGKLQCTLCRKIKPLSEFGISKSHWTGRICRCKDCKKLRRRTFSERLCRYGSTARRHRRQKRLDHSARRWKEVTTIWGDDCVYCGTPASTLDHVLATVSGGLNEVSNLVPACWLCNSTKWKRHPVDFLLLRISRNQPIHPLHELICTTFAYPALI